MVRTASDVGSNSADTRTEHIWHQDLTTHRELSWYMTYPIITALLIPLVYLAPQALHRSYC